jgi:plastocyanin
VRIARLIALAVAVAFAATACSSASTPAPTAAPTAAPATAPPASSGGGAGQQVSIKNFAFAPATVTAKVGGDVSWTNGDSTAHTVTFDDTSITSSGNIEGGGAFVGTFAKAGSFTYHCAIHPAMKGTVTVS